MVVCIAKPTVSNSDCKKLTVFCTLSICMKCECVLKEIVWCVCAIVINVNANVDSFKYLGYYIASNLGDNVDIPVSYTHLTLPTNREV